MSTDVYAGQLCATHVGEWVKHPELADDKEWICLEVRHQSHRNTVMVLARSQHPTEGKAFTEWRTIRIPPDDIVSFGVR